MTEPVDSERAGPAQESYLTLTELLITLALWMGAGWLVGGSIGMLVAGALVMLRVAIAIWRAAYPTGPGEKENQTAAGSATSGGIGACVPAEAPVTPSLCSGHVTQSDRPTVASEPVQPASGTRPPRPSPEPKQSHST